MEIPGYVMKHITDERLLRAPAELQNDKEFWGYTWQFFRRSEAQSETAWENELNKIIDWAKRNLTWSAKTGQGDNYFLLTITDPLSVLLEKALEAMYEE